MEWIGKNRNALALVFCLLLGCGLRFVGLQRGTSDYMVPEQAPRFGEEAYYHFHPDETTLVNAALELYSPFEPPLTAYGMLPLYLLRGPVELVEWLAGWDLGDRSAAAERRLFLLARALAALLGCAGLWLVYSLGRQFLEPPAALLATLFAGVAPLAVQQAHFYTVDGIFMVAALIFFRALLPALAQGGWVRYAGAGALVGLAAAVRLNGLLLGLLLLAGHLAAADRDQTRGWPGRILQRLRRPELWLAGAAALLVLFALQPFLLTDPGRLSAVDSTDDFALSLQIARGRFCSPGPWSMCTLRLICTTGAPCGRRALAGR